MPLATKASALDDDDHRKSLPDAKNTTAMTKPPLPRKPSLETTTKKDLSSTVGNDEAAKISSSAQPSPVVEKPVAQGAAKNTRTRPGHTTPREIRFQTKPFMFVQGDTSP